MYLYTGVAVMPKVSRPTWGGLWYIKQVETVDRWGKTWAADQSRPVLSSHVHFANISVLGILKMDLRNIQKTLPVITIGYVLKLENDKYYVGISGNINHRIAQHIAGEASRWSKLHKVISVQSLEVVPSVVKQIHC